MQITDLQFLARLKKLIEANKNYIKLMSQSVLVLGHSQGDGKTNTSIKIHRVSFDQVCVKIQKVCVTTWTDKFLTRKKMLLTYILKSLNLLNIFFRFYLKKNQSHE